ncbi:TPA: DUF1270 family protein [Staphylococcus argenteus]|nr:DUF1270 family protein [Staphylococcus argenteus]HDY9483219.1 DUF1270 family protein [Staphylococcus argenteus]
MNTNYRRSYQILYFTTAWSIAGFASIATFIFYKEYFYDNKGE